MTLDCVRPAQSSVIRIIHCNVGLKCFFVNFLKCLSLKLQYFCRMERSKNIKLCNVNCVVNA